MAQAEGANLGRGRHGVLYYWTLIDGRSTFSAMEGLGLRQSSRARCGHLDTADNAMSIRRASKASSSRLCETNSRAHMPISNVSSLEQRHDCGSLPGLTRHGVVSCLLACVPQPQSSRTGTFSFQKTHMRFSSVGYYISQSYPESSLGKRHSNSCSSRR